jgi:hypothetical protein
MLVEKIIINERFIFKIRNYYYSGNITETIRYGSYIDLK